MFWSIEDPGKFQRFNVLSLLAVTIKAPPPLRAAFPVTSYRFTFLERAVAPTASVWPVPTPIHCFVFKSHSRIV